MAVRPSALGVLVVTLLKMLTSTRNSVTSRAILPGITSMGIKKEIQETITNRPGKKNDKEGDNMARYVYQKEGSK